MLYLLLKIEGSSVKKIAVFASGRGSNFQAIYRHITRGELPAQIQCLITDNFRAGAIPFAEKHRIPVFVLSPKNFSSPEDFGQALLDVLARFQVEWIVLAGYLKKIPDNVVNAFPNRMVNIHPALLPAFGGKGMYGMNVHRAVYHSGAQVSGVTIHLVNQEYDAGPIVMQQAVDISGCRNPEEIAAKVLEVEHQLYPRALKRLFTSPFTITGKRVEFHQLEEIGKAG